MTERGVFDLPQLVPSREAGISELETKILWKVSHLISSSMLQKDVIQTALDGVIDTIGCDVAMFFLRHGSNLELEAMVPANFGLIVDAASGHHRVGQCLCGLAARDREPIYSLDITQDQRCSFQECKSAGIRSFAAIPMRDADGVLGILGLASRMQRDFAMQAPFLETLAAVISIGIRNSIQHEQVLRHTADLEMEIKERNRAEAAVRHSQAQLRTFVANAPYGITRASISHDVFLSVNPATVRVLGYDSEKEVLALRLTRDLYWDSEGRRDFLASLPPAGYFSGIEAHWRRKDKKQITVRISGWIVQDPVDPDDRIIEGLFEDVTQQQVLKEQLLHAQKMEAVGRLAGGIAHDFNNLLMVIMAQTELLLMDLKGAPRHRAEKVLEVSQRAAELTGQLLAFSRKQPIQTAITSMNRLLTGLSDMLPRLVGENIDVRIAQCDDPWPVKVDRSQLEQVIMNLAVNARDAMPDGGMLTLETENCEVGEGTLSNHPFMPPGRYVLLAVTDTGAGISPETQEHMFEPFFTTKESGKGTGLGLSMVYGIVKHHNGHIWVYSEPDHGACFKIYLPKAEVDEAVENKQCEPKQPPTKKKSTILLVEDDDNLRSVISEFLKLAGHMVIVARSLDEAFQLALDRKKEIDLLLTDVVLKDGNGNQLVARLQDCGCAFKVVYMSGYSPKAAVHQGSVKPGALFLQKPFSRSVLIEVVEEALTTKQ